MASVDELARLAGELRRISSPLQRMKLLARAWRSIQRLSPGDRKKLARNVGVDGAENLIERMAAQKGRVGPALIQRALDKVRETDPDQLKGLLQGLRDPVRRSAMIDRGLDAITGGMDEHEEVEEPLAEPEPEPIPVAAPEIEGQEIEPPATQPANEEVELEPPPLPPPPPEPQVIEDKPAPAVTEGLAELVEKEKTLIRRFRIFNANLKLAEDCEKEGLERLLDMFPIGWARRRALSALLRAGIPADNQQAGHLIDGLDSPVSRRWCRSILLRRPGR
jgi:hypothetical protein